MRASGMIFNTSHGYDILIFGDQMTDNPDLFLDLREAKNKKVRIPSRA